MSRVPSARCLLGSQHTQSSTVSVTFFTRTASKPKEESLPLHPPKAEAEAWALKTGKAVRKGVHSHTQRRSARHSPLTVQDTLAPAWKAARISSEERPRRDRLDHRASRSPRLRVSPEEDRRQSTAFAVHVRPARFSSNRPRRSSVTLTWPRSTP